MLDGEWRLGNKEEGGATEGRLGEEERISRRPFILENSRWFVVVARLRGLPPTTKADALRMMKHMSLLTYQYISCSRIVVRIRRNFRYADARTRNDTTGQGLVPLCGVD